jgi:hypothetical protein
MTTVRNTMATVFILVLALSTGCRSDAATIEKALIGVKTGDHERVAFEKVWKNVRVSFAPFDVDGKRIDMAVSSWQRQTAYIEFYADGRTIRHDLLDDENLSVLMRE